ncbi:MAG: phospholipid/cholesterol/gamma-HCH transport system permease protein [Planctomycetota bacterium]|jgi:phospholipid/cholesterol/gamma-HCH transport system permease protein
MGSLFAIVQGFGAAIVTRCLAAGYRLELLLSAILRLHHIIKRRALIMDQFWVGGIKVLHVVILVGFSIGMIVSLQTGLELSRFGQQDQIGSLVAVSMAREMGPFITATIVAAAVGSGIAAEIGTMAVSEELAALEVLSIDRASFLVMPRVVGLAILCPILTIVCDTVGIIGGGLVAQSQLGVGLDLYYDSALSSLSSPTTFFDLPKDVYSGLLKSFVFGIIISVISCSAGVLTRGGALGVGNATRAAVRDSIILVIITNYMMTWFFYSA